MPCKLHFVHASKSLSTCSSSTDAVYCFQNAHQQFYTVAAHQRCFSSAYILPVRTQARP